MLDISNLVHQMIVMSISVYMIDHVQMGCVRGHVTSLHFW